MSAFGGSFRFRSHDFFLIDSCCLNCLLAWQASLALLWSHCGRTMQLQMTMIARSVIADCLKRRLIWKLKAPK